MANQDNKTQKQDMRKQPQQQEQQRQEQGRDKPGKSDLEKDRQGGQPNQNQNPQR